MRREKPSREKPDFRAFLVNRAVEKMIVDTYTTPAD